MVGPNKGVTKVRKSGEIRLKFRGVTLVVTHLSIIQKKCSHGLYCLSLRPTENSGEMREQRGKVLGNQMLLDKELSIVYKILEYFTSVT